MQERKPTGENIRKIISVQISINCWGIVRCKQSCNSTVALPEKMRGPPASWAIPWILGNTKVHNRFHKSPPTGYPEPDESSPCPFPHFISWRSCKQNYSQHNTEARFKVMCAVHTVHTFVRNWDTFSKLTHDNLYIFRICTFYNLSY